MTWNNPSVDHRTVEMVHLVGTHRQAFQLERGDSGTNHYQMFVEYKNARSFDSMKKNFGQCHIEKTKQDESAIRYCTKAESRVEGPWTKNIDLETEEVDSPPKIKTITTFQPWQQSVLDILEQEPDNRSIYWFYDTTGNIGKTSLAKQICVNQNAIYLSGKSSDIKCGVATYIASKKPLHAAIFGFPRTNENFVSYEALEAVKDGIFFNGKYESGMVIQNSPHVIVFANFPPETSKLSNDRWRVVCLDETPSITSGIEIEEF